MFIYIFPNTHKIIKKKSLNKQIDVLLAKKKEKKTKKEE